MFRRSSTWTATRSSSHHPHDCTWLWVASMPSGPMISRAALVRGWIRMTVIPIAPIASTITVSMMNGITRPGSRSRWVSMATVSATAAAVLPMPMSSTPVGEGIWRRTSGPSATVQLPTLSSVTATDRSRVGAPPVGLSLS